MKRIRALLKQITISLRSFLKKVIESLKWLFDLFLGSIPSLIRADIILKRKLAKTLDIEIPSTDPRLKIPEDELKAKLEADFRRLERIEDKAKSTIFGAALSVSLASPGILLLVQSDVFADEAFVLKVMSAIVLMAAIFFLLISGYLSLSGYKVGELFQPNIEDHIKLIKPIEVRKVILRCIDLNTFRVLQRANLLSASMDCLRNGLILILVFLVLAAFSAL